MNDNIDDNVLEINGNVMEMDGILDKNRWKLMKMGGNVYENRWKQIEIVGNGKK